MIDKSLCGTLRPLCLCGKKSFRIRDLHKSFICYKSSKSKSIN